jgi:glutamyl-tRNA synthetase
MNIIRRYFSSAVKQARPDVRVRYAPSPTGNLHIGGLRTALYNYLFAKSQNGKFILRIEDTDKAREVKDSVDNIIKGMKWAGLSWDEGPGAKENTSYGPYFQSQRTDLYKKYAAKLIENGDAYHCFCSADRLHNLRETQMKNGETSKYDGHCRKLSENEVFSKLKSGEPHTIRLRVPTGGNVQIHDIIRGDVDFDYQNVDDQVLVKSDGYPTYHLANVIDDHYMDISHVIRGEVT